MNAPTKEYRVALVTAPGAPADALAPSAETLREFGVSSDVVPGEQATALPPEAAARWGAVIVASDTGDLPAAVAARVALPVIRVPVESASRSKLDLLVSGDGDLPNGGDGAPFATVAIGVAGAKNAALFVVSLLALDDRRLREAWERFRAAQTEAVLQQPPPALD